MLGFVVVDDGIVADIGDGVALVVDGRILGVNVGQVGAVVLVDVAAYNEPFDVPLIDLLLEPEPPP